MSLALHSSLDYEEIVAHSKLKLMTKLTDQVVVNTENHLSTKEQNEAMLSAWISNTEVKLLERKTKLDSSSWKQLAETRE